MRTLMISALLLAVLVGVAAGAQKGDYLSDEEADKLREAQMNVHREEACRDRHNRYGGGVATAPAYYT